MAEERKEEIREEEIMEEEADHLQEESEMPQDDETSVSDEAQEAEASPE